MALTTSEAVAQAVEQHSASPAGESDASAVNESTSSEPVSTQTPADAAGLAARQSPSSSTGTPTTQASDDDEAPKDEDWLTPEKRQRILNNAREKAEKRAEARVRSELEGTLGVRFTDREAVENVRAFLRDPAGYIESAVPHLVRMGRLKLPTQAPPSAPNHSQNGFKKPVPRLTADDGTTAYDAAAVDEHIEHLNRTFEQRINELSQQMAPLTQMQQQLEAQRVESESSRYATEKIAEMQTWDGFEELRPEIYREMKADGRVTPESAYIRLYNTKYLPKQKQRHRQETLDDLKKRPVPPTGVSPSAAPRSSSAVKNGIRTAREAVEFAVQKHS